jgi:ubiquinone/menaquinone biosynthesis C-methylase UbiE
LRVNDEDCTVASIRDATVKLIFAGGAMDHREVGRYWNENASAWTRLVRAGYDVYRDYLNTPAFLAMLPDVQGLFGIDIGCGEGGNTRLTAARGARLVGVDISEVFVKYAKETYHDELLRIEYCVASAVELPFSNDRFDFATAFMSLMDIPETDRSLAEAFRVIKPGGFLQFSITHPCFDTPYRRNLRNQQGLTYAIEVGDYFRNLNGDIREWLFGAAPGELKQQLARFKVPFFTRTISQWFNLIVQTGFVIERVEEPRPADATVRECPDVQDAQVVAYFLHVRVRKPTESTHADIILNPNADKNTGET